MKFELTTSEKRTLLDQHDDAIRKFTSHGGSTPQHRRINSVGTAEDALSRHGHGSATPMRTSFMARPSTAGSTADRRLLSQVHTPGGDKGMDTHRDYADGRPSSAHHDSSSNAQSRRRSVMPPTPSYLLPVAVPVPLSPALPLKSSLPEEFRRKFPISKSLSEIRHMHTFLTSPHEPLNGEGDWRASPERGSNAHVAGEESNSLSNARTLDRAASAPALSRPPLAPKIGATVTTSVSAPPDKKVTTGAEDATGPSELVDEGAARERKDARRAKALTSTKDFPMPSTSKKKIYFSGDPDSEKRDPHVDKREPQVDEYFSESSMPIEGKPPPLNRALFAPSTSAGNKVSGAATASSPSARSGCRPKSLSGLPRDVFEDTSGAVSVGRGLKFLRLASSNPEMFDDIVATKRSTKERDRRGAHRWK